MPSDTETKLNHAAGQSLNSSLDLTRDQPTRLEAGDSFANHKVKGREEIDTIDTQLANLERTIELEQQKLRESKAALDSSYHSRARLLHLRNAMLHFVMELESREDES
jgi:hypothetical protein